jgi:hypothetical protein
MLLGEKMDVGRLTHEFTSMNLSKKKTANRKRAKKSSAQRVHLLAVGTKVTVMTIRQGDLPQAQQNA